MNFTEDTAAMLADFGVTATLDGVSVEGIFDNGSTSGLSNMMLGSNPTFTCRSADAPSSKRNKTLVVGSVSYTVREIKEDGTGMSVLELEQV
ncbi:MAG TPA: hypothetical protein DCK83_00420 [Gallionellaceae bacterium]|nr:hypothetical protein [Gallionellaceae bacterium]